MKTIDNLKKRYAAFQALDARDKKTFWKEFSLNAAARYYMHGQVW